MSLRNLLELVPNTLKMRLLFLKLVNSRFGALGMAAGSDFPDRMGCRKTGWALMGIESGTAQIPIDGRTVGRFKEKDAVRKKI